METEQQSFFMASKVIRRRRNYIQFLKDDEGKEVDRIEDIAQLFIKKFTTTFSISKPRHSLDMGILTQDLMGHLWEGGINFVLKEDEVFHALSSMGAEKAPGLDGLPVAFFRAHWDTIKKDLLAMIHSFFNGGKLPHFINDTNLILIPKKECPSTVNDYRPIALCNVLYKLI